MYVSLLMHISESFFIPNFDLNHEEKQREIQEIEEELARDLFKTPTYARDIYTYLQVCTMDARVMYHCLQVPIEICQGHIICTGDEIKHTEHKKLTNYC